MNEAHINMLLHVTAPRVERNGGDSARDRDAGAGFKDQLSLLAPLPAADPRAARRTEEQSRDSKCSPCDDRETTIRSSDPIKEPHDTPQPNEVVGGTENSAGHEEVTENPESQPSGFDCSGSNDSGNGEEAVDDGVGLDAQAGTGKEKDEDSEAASATGVDVAVSLVAAVTTRADQVSISPEGGSADFVGQVQHGSEASGDEPGVEKSALRALSADGEEDQHGLPHITTGNAPLESTLTAAAVSELNVEDELVSPDTETKNPEDSDQSDGGRTVKSHDRTKFEAVDAVADPKAAAADNGSAEAGRPAQSDVAAAGSDVIGETANLLRTSEDGRGHGERRTSNVTAASDSSAAPTAVTANVPATTLSTIGPIQTEALSGATAREVGAIARGSGNDSAATSENAAVGQGRRSFGAAGLTARDSAENVDGPRVDTARFVGRVTRAFHFAQERGGTLQLRLSPPELGALRLELTVHEGVLSASLEAETPAARRLLLDNLPALREKLAEQNVRVERFDVDLRRDEREGQSGAFHDRRQQQQHEQGDWQSHTAQTAGKSRAVQPIQTTVERQTTAVTTSSGINLVI